MEFIYTYIRRKGIRFQLLVSFISLILLSVIILASIGNVLYSNAVKKEVNIYTGQVINQINNNIDFYIRDMEDITFYLSQDSDVIEFLNMDVNSKNVQQVKEKIKKSISLYESANPEIAGILILNENDMDVSNNMIRISRDPLIFEKWYIQPSNYPGEIHLFSKPIGRKINATTNYSADDVVSIVKAVRDEKRNRVIGVILIDMRLDIIKKVIEDGKFGDTGFVYIMDSNGEIVYSPVNSIVNRIKYNWFINSNKFIKNIKNEQYQITYNYSNYTKWNTIGVVSLKENQKVVHVIKLYTIIIALGILTLGIIAALFFSASIAKPIKKLRGLMKMAEEGDLNVRFDNKYDDEIGQLGKSFNNMIEKIKNLINLVYVEQKRKREAELKILEEQIKPHFLYNTLDTIQWMAQEHGAKDIIDIIKALTSLFRIGLNKGKEQVKIKDELKHIESYLTIQMARYEDKLSYNISYEETILEYSVTKIILQPIVENAIYHGIKAKRGKGHISIDVKKIDNKIVFTVEDNGAGMTMERLEEINKIITGKEGSYNNKGFGVFNVNERIKLSYGEEYGLKIYSKKNEGTKVEIYHPIINL